MTSFLAIEVAGVGRAARWGIAVPARTELRDEVEERLARGSACFKAARVRADGFSTAMLVVDLVAVVET